jgi:hypothetical protein
VPSVGKKNCTTEGFLANTITLLSQVEASRPWREFDIHVPPMVTEIFEVATSSIVDDGATTFF